MKILYINSVAKSGSTGKLTSYLSEYMGKRDCETVIAYGRKEEELPNIKTNSYYKIENQIGNYIHGVKSMLFDSQGLGSERATYKFLDFIESYKPDIIHINNLHGYYINYSILLRKLSEMEIPIVWTFHDMWPFSGHSAYIDENKIINENLYYLEDNNKKYPRAFINRFERNFKMKKKAVNEMKRLTIVTPSKWLKDVVGKTIFKEFPILHISNGIDLAPFTHASKNVEKQEKKIILGIANKWEARKGLEYFLELSHYLNDEYEIILVGEIPNRYKPLPKNCFNIEHTKDVNVLADIYAKAFVFLNPTLEDNFPTTNIEALASGTPVITFRTGGSPEVVLNAAVGRIVEENDSREVLKNIMSFDVTNKTSKECRKVAELFSIDIMGEKYFNLYLKILAKKR